MLDAVARLRRLGRYHLRELDALGLHDRYFDTAAAGLAARGLALRLREGGGRRLLALKGEERSGRGGMERLELELSWSTRALDRVCAALGDAGIGLASSAPPAADAGDPAATLRDLDLSLVQDLETHRRRRLFVSGAGPALAELDIDCVTYRVGDGIVRLHEVEIEVRDRSFDLAAAASCLRARVPALVPWPHNKLAVGIALSRAAAAGWLALAPDGALSTHALEEIERALGHVSRVRM